MYSQFSKNIFFWIIAFIILVVGFNALQNFGHNEDRISLPISELMSKIDNKEINKVRIRGNTVEGQLSSGQRFSAYAEGYRTLIDRLCDNNVTVEVVPVDTRMTSILGMLLSWIPMLLPICIWAFFMHQMNTGGRTFGFGKSKAKLSSDKSPRVTFDDVAGADEAKEELREIVDFLRDPGKFQKLGGRIPRGCLLVGPPGTGKTLLARAIAGEAGVPFFSISGSDFVEMFVGVGASRVRDMFEQGKRNAPCIIFIDEIDAVGRHRGSGRGGTNDEREQTLNQMLVELDGFDVNEGVIIIAATNRPDVLDTALLRPGRFDRQVIVPNPDLRGREQILKVHLKKVRTAEGIDPRTLARGTVGLSGADLANLVNEAALLAAKQNKKTVDNQDLENARDKVLMGTERRSSVMSEEEKKITAYHEAGHALVILKVKNHDPIHKATIVPRGTALGMVMHLPEKDSSLARLDQMESSIAVAMGGRVAEEIIFGRDKITWGAASDIKNATMRARMMVKEWGMSEKLGPVYHGSDEYGHYTSTYTNEIIDKEVYSKIEQGYNTAKQILSTHLDDLHKLAQALLEKETLTGEEIKQLLSLPEELPTDDKDQRDTF